MLMTFGDTASSAGPPSSGLLLKVYTANVENLLHKREDCEGDWDELVYYMAGAKSVPTIILLQQVNDQPYNSSKVQIVGGDMTITDRTKSGPRKWYREMIAAKFADAEAADPEWTHISRKGAGAKRRIDYIFARYGTSTPATFRNPHTVT